MTREELNQGIDDILNDNIADYSLSPSAQAGVHKLVADYIDQQISNAGSSSATLTSGSLTLSATPQVLPYDINSVSFSGGIGYLPATTQIGKEIIVFTASNVVEIRANASNTNRLIIESSINQNALNIIKNQTFKFTYIGFGSGVGGQTDGYWKAEKISTHEHSYRCWRAVVNASSVIRVLADEIGFSSPVITNPYNGKVIVTKTGVFTGIDPDKVDISVSNLSNSGQIYTCLASQGGTFGENPNDCFLINIFDMAGTQTGTPAGSLTVEVRIYD